MKNKYVDIKGVKLIFAKCKELVASSSGTGDNEDRTKLKTTDKTSLVDAINELYYAVFNVSYDMSAWQDSNVTSGDYLALAVASDGTIVIGSTDVGIKYSTDNGKTWQNSSITSGSYQAFAVASDGTIVVSSDDSGIKYSSDNGKTWQNSSITSGNYLALAVAQDGTLVAGSTTGIKYCPVTKTPKWESA